MKILNLALLFTAVVILVACSYCARAIWGTRAAALPGLYKAQGAWGTSTLELRENHTFKQSVSFTNQFNAKPQGMKVALGIWSDDGRSSLARKFELSSFVNLSPSAAQSVAQPFNAQYKTLGTGFGIEIDPGASIYYWKNE